MKILIAAPLRQELHIFREYQRSLDELKIPEGVTVDRFFVVNDCPEVIPHIRNAAPGGSGRMTMRPRAAFRCLAYAHK